MVSHILNSSNNQKHPTLPIHMQDSFGSACDVLCTQLLQCLLSPYTSPAMSFLQLPLISRP